MSNGKIETYISLDNQPFRFTKDTISEIYDYFVNGEYRTDLQVFPDDYTVSTKKLILVDEDITIVCDNPNFKYYIHFWNLQRYRSYGTGWFTGKKYLIPKNTKVWLSIKKVDGSAFRVDEAKNAVSFSLDCTMAEEFKNEIESFGSDTTEIPSYWKNTVDKTIDTIVSNRYTQSLNSVEFFYLTDEHWLSSAQNSPKIINYLHNRCGIHLMLSGGDVDGYCESEYEMNHQLTDFFGRFDKTLKIVSTNGNHDFNRTEPPTKSPWQSEISVYNNVFKSQERFMDTKHSIWCNYYDDPLNKVRYIQFESTRGVLNSTRKLVEQYVSELDSDWNYLLLCHVYFDLNDWDIKTQQWLCDVVDSSDANLIAMFTGHLHYDKDTVLTTNKGKKIIILSTATDSHYSAQYSKRYEEFMGKKSYEMIVGTDSEQLFDVVQIDIPKRTIKMTRVGLGENREFKF